jgi:hypothetical protein
VTFTARRSEADPTCADVNIFTNGISIYVRIPIAELRTFAREAQYITSTPDVETVTREYYLSPSYMGGRQEHTPPKPERL